MIKSKYFGEFGGTFIPEILVATFDQPMITNWFVEQQRIQERLTSMKRELPTPYRHASLPELLRPEQILPSL